MMNLREAHKDFVEDLQQKNRSASTRVAYNKDVEQLVEYLNKHGVEAISEVNIDHLHDFMSHLEKNGITFKTISRKTNATKTFFNFLHINGHLKENVGSSLKHPKLTINPPRILSKTEYRALRDAAREDIRTYAIVEVLIQTGITISELAGLQLKHLEYTNEKGLMFIPRVGARFERSIPLNKAAIEAITKYINDERTKSDTSFHLFTTKSGRPMLIRNIRATINRYFKKADVKKATVNDLRHTFVAHHLAQGVSIIHLSRIVGHKRLSTTERYLSFIEKETDSVKTELGIL